MNKKQLYISLIISFLMPSFTMAKNSRIEHCETKDAALSPSCDTSLSTTKVYIVSREATDYFLNSADTTPQVNSFDELSGSVQTLLLHLDKAKAKGEKASDEILLKAGLRFFLGARNPENESANVKNKTLAVQLMEECDHPKASKALAFMYDAMEDEDAKPITPRTIKQYNKAAQQDGDIVPYFESYVKKSQADKVRRGSLSVSKGIDKQSNNKKSISKLKKVLSFKTKREN